MNDLDFLGYTFCRVQRTVRSKEIRGVCDKIRQFTGCQPGKSLSAVIQERSMGYFEGLVEAAIKKDKNGNTVFYPWGVLGKGRVITDPDNEAELRIFLLRFYKIMLPLAVVAGIFRVWLVVAIMVVVLTSWFLIATRRLLVEAPFSDERLTLREGYKNSAARHNRFTLWVLFISSLLFVAGGIFIALKAHDLTHIAYGLGCAAFFALCGLAIGYMLSTKHA